MKQRWKRWLPPRSIRYGPLRTYRHAGCDQGSVQNFKEELNAIEQWFRVLSEAERTAALYSLLQSSTQVQIRFFITVLQQMARADPITALLSPSNPQQGQSEVYLSF